MRGVTMDTNCIYDLEQRHPCADALKHLIQAHEKGIIELRIPAIAASEVQRGGERLSDFGAFKGRLAKCGLGAIKILRAMASWDVTYWDWFVWVGPEMLAEERRIHEVLFPTIQFDADDFYAAHGGDRSNVRLVRRWRNAKCNVQAMWCHIHNAGEMFVTSDSNFLKSTKKSRLESIGAGAIARPDAAVAWVGSL